MKEIFKIVKGAVIFKVGHVGQRGISQLELL